MMERLTIGEVARRSGISIRMLRHYDEIGLVRPERSPHNGYRRYRPDDILRIQAIVALRQLGFGLSEIDGLLANDLGPFARSLELRMQAIDREIADRERLRSAMKRMLGQLADNIAPSLDDMFDVLGEMMRMEKVNRYYTPDQLEELRARADALGEDGMRQSQQAWAELMSDVRALIDAGIEPTDPRAHAAVDRWDELIAAFTGGNPGIAKNLNRVWESETEIEGTEAATVRELGAWIERARQARPD